MKCFAKYVFMFLSRTLLFDAYGIGMTSASASATASHSQTWQMNEIQNHVKFIATAEIE